MFSSWQTSGYLVKNWINPKERTIKEEKVLEYWRREGVNQKVIAIDLRPSKIAKKRRTIGDSSC